MALELNFRLNPHNSNVSLTLSEARVPYLYVEGRACVSCVVTVQSLWLYEKQAGQCLAQLGINWQ